MLIPASPELVPLFVMLKVSRLTWSVVIRTASLFPFPSIIVFSWLCPINLNLLFTITFSVYMPLSA